jgi:hypothetical protein
MFSGEIKMRNLIVQRIADLKCLIFKMGKNDKTQFVIKTLKFNEMLLDIIDGKIIIQKD